MKAQYGRLVLGFIGAAAALILAACDPLAPQPSPVVVVVKPTSNPTSLPTAVPSLTPTITQTPTPTATPTATLSPTPTPRTCQETVGRAVEMTFDSTITGKTMKYRAFLPPCYFDTGRRYPVVYLMHGADQDYTLWIDQLKIDVALNAGLAMRALPPMILIMPDGGTLLNLNIFTSNGSYEAVILKDLMPSVEANFCTWNSREGRAIGGISRGGFWAYEIGFRHPDLFGAIGGHSPGFYWDNGAPEQFNPMYMASSVKFDPGSVPRMWVDVGSEDQVRPNLEDFQKAITARKLDINYTVNTGGNHTIEYWAAHISEYLAFYGQTWPRNIQDLPSCVQK